MIGPDAVGLAAGIIGAMVFTWLIESTTLRLLGVKPSWVAIMRGFGIALVSLVMLFFLRLFTPDLFNPPLLFLAAFTMAILTSGRSSPTSERLAISILTSIIAVGALVLADGALRLLGHRPLFGL